MTWVLKFAVCVFAIGFADSAYTEQFSVRCARDGWYFLTFDTQARKVIWESPSERAHSGTAMRGNIISFADAEINFELLRVGQPPVKATLNRTSGQLIPAVAPGVATWIWQCEKTELRPILGTYDRIAPYE